ncbi:MAG: hypothetical protein JNK45_29785 [Myxococcales bacterium]|nr:hypothetical protein [Myxococcales bacterium]
MSARWIFDALPPSGARRGDDPAQHAFRPDLATFVREVIQNANDQALGAPIVAFRGLVLRGPELAAFRRAIDWSALAEHLRSTSATRTGARIGAALAEIDRRDELPLLCIEDRHTVGLLGGEDDEQSHFRALCKDTLFSHKRAAGAGGSYGLGKSVLWAFSGLRTVLFASRLSEHPAGRTSPRVIGRAELPSHQLGGEGFVGSGWFGRPATLPDGRARAESVWGAEAAGFARALGIAREGPTGTSILVIGVRDPTADTDDDDDTDGARTIAAMLSRIHGHAAGEFWPAMLREASPLAVEVDGRRVDPLLDAAAAPFVECLRGRAKVVDQARDDGDIVIREIPFEVPRRRGDKHATVGKVELVVRLADAPDRPGVGKIAAYRGAGMIVRRWDASRLAATLRPFHAILRCGLAHGSAESDDAIERFLRAAEPPGHDDWIATPTVKDEYVRGAQAEFARLHDRVMGTLRELLAPSSRTGVRGPERLRKRLALTGKGTKRSAPGPVAFHSIDAALHDGRWHFEGQIRARREGVQWAAHVAVRQVGEDGTLGDDVPIAAIEALEHSGEARLDRGRAELRSSTQASMVAFRGSTVPLRGAHAWTGEVALELVAAELESLGREAVDP